MAKRKTSRGRSSRRDKTEKRERKERGFRKWMREIREHAGKMRGYHVAETKAQRHAILRKDVKANGKEKTLRELMSIHNLIHKKKQEVKEDYDYVKNIKE